MSKNLTFTPYMSTIDYAANEVGKSHLQDFFCKKRIELSRLASKLIKQPVLNISFQEMEFENEFDGIWASASLLHIPRTSINDVFSRFKKALKQYGILYASFKYGNKEYERDDSFLIVMRRIQLMNFLLIKPSLKC